MSCAVDGLYFSLLVPVKNVTFSPNVIPNLYIANTKIFTNALLSSVRTFLYIFLALCMIFTAWHAITKITDCLKKKVLKTLNIKYFFQMFVETLSVNMIINLLDWIKKYFKIILIAESSKYNMKIILNNKNTIIFFYFNIFDHY